MAEIIIRKFSSCKDKNKQYKQLHFKKSSTVHYGFNNAALQFNYKKNYIITILYNTQEDYTDYFDLMPRKLE